MASKNFVVEIADLDQERREVVFTYGGREITVAYNPGAVTREAIEAEREDQQTSRRHALFEALDNGEADEYLDTEGGAGYVSDPAGLADMLLETIAASDRQNDVLIDALAGVKDRAPLLVDWPLVEDGDPLPITHETLAQRPYMFVAAMYGAIMEDMTPGKKRSRTQAPRGRRRR